jgi:hypothetical protein
LQPFSKKSIAFCISFLIGDCSMPLCYIRPALLHAPDWMLSHALI